MTKYLLNLKDIFVENEPAAGIICQEPDQLSLLWPVDEGCRFQPEDH